MDIIDVAIKKRKQLMKVGRFDHDKARWDSFLNYCQRNRLNVRYVDWLYNIAR
jgi:hypothetical protein